MKNTVIWDMDGTILDTLEDLKDSVNYAVTHCGFQPYEAQDIRAMLGNGIKFLMEQAVPNGLHNPKFDDCFNIFKRYYQLHMNDKTRPYDGIFEVMQKLKDKGYKQAIVSNKIDNAVQNLAKIYYPLVDIAIGERNGLRRKPQPDMVWAALDELGSLKENAVYIGDSEIDLATAQNSDLDCICVAWGFRDVKTLAAAGAGIIVEKPAELFDALDKMQER